MCEEHRRGFESAMIGRCYRCKQVVESAVVFPAESVVHGNYSAAYCFDCGEEVIMFERESAYGVILSKVEVKG